VVIELCERTDRHANRRNHHNTSHPSRCNHSRFARYLLALSRTLCERLTINFEILRTQREYLTLKIHLHDFCLLASVNAKTDNAADIAYNINGNKQRKKCTLFCMAQIKIPGCDGSGRNTNTTKPLQLLSRQHLITRPNWITDLSNSVSHTCQSTRPEFCVSPDWPDKVVELAEAITRWRCVPGLSRFSGSVGSSSSGAWRVARGAF